MLFWSVAYVLQINSESHVAYVLSMFRVDAHLGLPFKQFSFYLFFIYGEYIIAAHSEFHAHFVVYRNQKLTILLNENIYFVFIYERVEMTVRERDRKKKSERKINIDEVFKLLY